MTDGAMAPRFAVVGTGAISQVMHIPILAEREDVDLAVLADLDVAKARTIADRMGVPEALDPDEVLRREDLDAIVLCTPNGVHEEMAVRALEAGKDVFVERPVAITPEGVERVLGVARERGRRLVVGQPHRFRADATALRSFVAGGEMGEIYAVRGSWLTRRIPILRPTWRQRKAEAGGGALVELGVPSLDLCLWLVGYPTVRRVSCVTMPGDFDVEDAATAAAGGTARWSVAAIEALFALPFTALLHRAQAVHREHHAPDAVQLSTLLSIKTGGCPEDCGYCPQAKRHHTGVADEALLDLVALDIEKSAIG